MNASVSATMPEAAQSPRILVIDDEPDLRTLYELSLTRAGYQVRTAANVVQSLDQLSSSQFDVVISDMQLPDGSGLDILRHMSSTQRSERCVVITAHGSAQNAVDALKAGAFDYLTKPVDLKQFRAVIAQAVDSVVHAAALPASQQELLDSEVRLDTDVAEQALSRIVGSSQAMAQVRSRIARVARSMAPVFIHGESGTGKELVARAVHACSHRASEPFVAVNCSAIPEHLLEAEFFGAKKGAYTGASQDRLGFFQAAHGGTLFLDEIGELPLAMQAKLLRVIQERCVRPLGDTQELAVNVRLLSATHRDLQDAVAQGLFRQDLYYRIHVIDISLPPLRQRKQDLPELVNALLLRMSRDMNIPAPVASPNLLEQLQSLALLGNVRELENLLQRAVALSDGHELTLDIDSEARVSPLVGTPSAPNTESSPNGTPDPGLPKDLQAHLDAQEKQIIIQALRDAGFNRTAAAARLGISLRQIRYRMDRLGLQEPEIDKGA
jgi:two-component system, NtrC family, response regulator PilR